MKLFLIAFCSVFVISSAILTPELKIQTKLNVKVLTQQGVLITSRLESAGEKVKQFYQSRKQKLPTFVNVQVTGSKFKNTFKVYTVLLIDEPDYVQGANKNQAMSFYLEKDSSILKDKRVFGRQKFSDRALVFSKYNKYLNFFVLYVDNEYFSEEA